MISFRLAMRSGQRVGGQTMSMRFDNKVAVVTGAATGIGAATARKFVELGAGVALLDCNASQVEKTAAEVGGAARGYVCDVRKSDDVERAVATAARDFGGIDVLVSNAGIQRYGTVETTSEQTWDEVLDTNLKGFFLAAKFATPHIIARGGGAIVAVGSVQSVAALGNAAAYVTSKHGVLGLTRSLALDYARQNVRANCVLPASIDTPMLRWAANLDPDPQRVLATCDRMHALGRIGRAEEVANAIAFLASDWASFITGAALLVDGGMLTPAGGMGFLEGGTGTAAQSE
jgi:NAD(P)-dependent dehydrogenase (short-subunit alcohol dehydrogenase family)